jgi:hypothetical protein
MLYVVAKMNGRVKRRVKILFDRDLRHYENCVIHLRETRMAIPRKPKSKAKPKDDAPKSGAKAKGPAVDTPKAESTAAPDTKPGAFGTVLSGLGNMKDMTVKKAKTVQLGSQLSEVKRKLGRAALEKKIDCGEVGAEVASAHQLVEHMTKKVAAANEALGKADGIKGNAWATKEFAVIKTRQAKAQLDLRSAFEKLGAYVLEKSIKIPGSEADIAQAKDLQSQIAALNSEVSDLGGSLKDKWGSLWGKK